MANLPRLNGVGYIDKLTSDEAEFEEKVNAAIAQMTKGVGTEAGARADTKRLRSRRLQRKRDREIGTVDG